jgi:hypothetical protein
MKARASSTFSTGWRKTFMKLVSRLELGSGAVAMRYELST